MSPPVELPAGPGACETGSAGLNCPLHLVQNGKKMSWLPYAAMAAGLMVLFFMGIGYLWVKVDKDDPDGDES